MSVAVDHAFVTGTDDVRCALRWLLDHDFALEESEGPGDFGNVWLVLSREDCRIEVARDRSQWTLVLQPAWAPQPFALQAVLAAMAGRRPAAMDEPDWETVHEQLPPGISWCVELPEVVRWLSDPERQQALAEVEAEWRAFISRRFQRMADEYDAAVRRPR